MRQPAAAPRRAAGLGASASPPTGRVLDVVELLARRAGRALTLTDVVRELGITYATADAILATLGGRGWVHRDAGDKSDTLGPALALAARQAESADSRQRLARATAADLVRALGFSTSVTQIVTGAVVITSFFAPRGADPRAHPGDRVPLTAPFGGGFVAWEPVAIRQRGFAGERMSSSARQVLDLAKDLRAGVVSDAMRESIERLLAEITSASHLPDDLHDTPKAYGRRSRRRCAIAPERRRSTSASTRSGRCRAVGSSRSAGRWCARPSGSAAGRPPPSTTRTERTGAARRCARAAQVIRRPTGRQARTPNRRNGVLPRRSRCLGVRRTSSSRRRP